ncbi:uncharacterized protein LOC105226192 [Bactrocera dorsalis]|uniref:Uncharacterized protein LOC105226192 n=1 Tax=Bactrocera dorsalis TaxID=27457 RepID=A0A6I9VIF9_BACDO|nr:uncharacterized protein LOC105226192 [Bactrocera dorsalis]
MKTTVQICVLFALFAVAFAWSSTWGVRNATDVLLFSKNVFKPAIVNQVQYIYFDIPETLESNNSVISAIYLQDQFKNSSGPSNNLYYGGPGWTYASIQMRTYTSVGLNVTFVVYGQRNYY